MDLQGPSTDQFGLGSTKPATPRERGPTCALTGRPWAPDYSKGADTVCLPQSYKMVVSTFPAAAVEARANEQLRRPSNG
jgi:hypothetical protein